MIAGSVVQKVPDLPIVETAGSAPVDINLERLIDESLLRELDKAGFIDQAYGVKSAR